VKQDKQKVFDKLCDLQERFNNLEAMMQEKVREYEERIEEEHWQKLNNEENHQVTIAQLKERMTEMERIAISWKVSFS